MVQTSMVTLHAPAGWSVDLHEDGAGADLTSGDLHLRVTLIPASFFESVFVELPVPTQAQDLVRMLGTMLSPLAAATSSEAAMIGWEGVDVASVTANDADTSSTIFAFEAVPGVVVIATAWSSAATFEENAARSVVASIRVTASPGEVTAAIDPPPPPDFPMI